MNAVLDRRVKPALRAMKYDRLYRRAVREAASGTGRSASRVPNCVFIIGCGRSGTSILGTLLALHPDVRYVREPYHLWAAVDPRTDATNLYVRGDGRCLMDGALVDDDVRSRFASLFGAGADDGRLLVEKTPHNALRIGYLESLTDDARYVHIARNGCEVVRSIASLADANAYRIAGRADYNQWWGTNDAKWRNLSRDGAAVGYFADEVPGLRGNRQRAAYEWLVSVEEVDRRRAGLGDRLVEVTYESLTADPATVLRRLADALGLSPDDAWVRSAAERVHPARPAADTDLPLPPAMMAAFNDHAERYGTSGRAVAADVGG